MLYDFGLCKNYWQIALRAWWNAQFPLQFKLPPPDQISRFYPTDLLSAILLEQRGSCIVS